MQFFGIEDIKNLSKASPTTVNWEAGSNLRIGGQAYNVTSVLTLDTATDIDTGSIANNSFYYIYAVVVAGTVSLKYSLSKESPTGYNAYRRIGALSTDGSSNILDAQRGKSFQKCQTKILTGNETTDMSYVNDLKFSNLEASRFYKLFFQAQIFTDPGTFVSVEIFNADNANTNQIGRIYQLSGSTTANVITRSDTYVFKNLSNAVSFYYTDNGAGAQRLEGNTSKNETFATLCELPDDGFDNTIETNEWTP